MVKWGNGRMNRWTRVWLGIAVCALALFLCPCPATPVAVLAESAAPSERGPVVLEDIVGDDGAAVTVPPAVPSGAPGQPDDLSVTATVKPAQLVTPGEVSITFVVTNRSSYDVQNVIFSTDNILGSGHTEQGAQSAESIGRIAVGESQSVVLAHTVTQAELDAGSIDFYITYGSMRPGSTALGCVHPVEIVKASPSPSVDFTRQFSSRYVAPGGTLTVTYRLLNTGNVPVTALRIRDALGGFAAHLEQLPIGEARSFISRVAIEEDAVSAPVLVYADPAGAMREIRLDEAEIHLARGALKAGFSVSESPFNPDTADATLTLRNQGNADCTGIVVMDAVYGGVIADAITVPAGGAPVQVTFSYPLRSDESQYRWLITGQDGAGNALNLATETVTLRRRPEEQRISLALEAIARTPKINRPGTVTFDITVANMGTLMAEDCLLYEVDRGEVRRLAVLPAETSVSIPVSYSVKAGDPFIFCANYTDADGRKRTISTAPIEVEISADGVAPEDADAPADVPGGDSLKLGSTRTFGVLLAIAAAALLVMITIMVTATLHARRDRRRRIAAERQRMKEEMGKTNPFTPIKQKQLRRRQKRARTRQKK